MKFSVLIASAILASAVSAAEMQVDSSKESSSKSLAPSSSQADPTTSKVTPGEAEPTTSKAAVSTNSLSTSTSTKAEGASTTSIHTSTVTTAAEATVTTTKVTEAAATTTSAKNKEDMTKGGESAMTKEAPKEGAREGNMEANHGVSVTPVGPVATVDTHIQIDAQFTVKTTEDLTLPNGLVIRKTDITTISEKINIDVKVVTNAILDVYNGLTIDVTTLVQTISIKYSLSSDLVFALADKCTPLFKPNTDIHNHFQSISTLRTNQAVITTINQSQRVVFKTDSALYFNGQQILDIATITTFATRVSVTVEVFGSVFTEFSRFKPSDDYRAHCRYVADKYKIQVAQVLQIANVCAPVVQKQVPEVAPIVAQIATYQAPQVEELPIPMPDAVYAPEKQSDTVVVADATVPVSDAGIAPASPAGSTPASPVAAPGYLYSGSGSMVASTVVAIVAAFVF
ncbi:hypothetical protein BC830DRAFT_1100747 [Chytriomyces sp. MP71]|nr:hypothetical protein BC830DRAFT_1100747 [Chytriomyces sp. MP71]